VLHPDKRAAGVTEDEAKDRFQRLVEAFKVRA
jgi:curved DNA-binding protein CbpA